MRRNLDPLKSQSQSLTPNRLEELNNTVSELYEKALQNEQILQRYQHFELKLLDLADFEGLINTLLVEAVDYFQLAAVELWLYDPQDTLSELLASDILQNTSLRFLSSLKPLKQLYAEQPKVRLVSIFNEKNSTVFSDQGMRSAALLPLLRQGVLVGSLHFGAKGHHRFTNDKSTDFIAHLASIVAVCFENTVNQERLHRLGMYDMLTKVKNRRAFDQSLEKEVSRSARNGECLSLLFIDLDYFKKVNDNYGHQAGDKVLKVVAQFINDMSRKTDHVCRYGGEEFAVILPSCSQQKAMDIAERMRQSVKQLNVSLAGFERSDCESITISLSIGVCCWLPEKATDQCCEQKVSEALIACADRGVYMAKEAGRDKVCYAALKANI